jgi:hypothetical protein
MSDGISMWAVLHLYTPTQVLGRSACGRSDDDADELSRLVLTTNWIDELTKAFLSGTRED